MKWKQRLKKVERGFDSSSIVYRPPSMSSLGPQIPGKSETVCNRLMRDHNPNSILKAFTPPSEVMYLSSLTHPKRWGNKQAKNLNKEALAWVGETGEASDNGWRQLGTKWCGLLAPHDFR